MQEPRLENSTMRNFLVGAAVAFSVGGTAAWAPQLQAQGYPNKPIRVVIGYAPGGSADAGIRPLARVLEPLLGQPLIIENKPGNAGGVAMEFMVKAPNDGYTLYYFDSGPLTVAPHLAKVGYNSVTSFTQLGHVCGSGSMLAVHPSTPFKSMDAINATGCDAAILPPAQTLERIKTDYAKWGRVVKEANIKAE